MVNVARNPGVEAFRCLMMFLIVLGHVGKSWCLETGLEPMGGLLRGALAFHVVGFLAISGWFGIKFKWSKFIGLLGQMMFYLLLDLSVRIYLGNIHSFSDVNFSVSMVGNWFGGAYLLLMLMVPFLNAGLDELARGSKRQLLVCWLLMAFGFFMQWLPYNGFMPIHTEMTSCSLMTLVFLYLTMGTARRLFDRPISSKMLILPLLQYPVVLLALRFVGGRWNYRAEYFAPHVYVFALALFLLFLWHVKIPQSVGRLACFLAPSMFGVYLLHETTSIGSGIYLLPMRWLGKCFGLSGLPLVVIGSLIAFTVCVIVDFVRRLLTEKIIVMSPEVLKR